MADSDNSRTLPTVTRGEFHSFVVASLPTPHGESRPLLPDRGDDPALAVWTQWCATWKRLCESVLRQQQLETALISYVRPCPHDQAATSAAYEEALQAEACASVAEAHEYLIDALNEFESAAIVRRTDVTFGDVVFGTDSVVLFARANLVVLVRKASPQTEAVLPIAQTIDALILARLKVG